MATVFQRQKNGNFYIKFQHKNETVYESTGTNVKKKALALLRRRLAETKDGLTDLSIAMDSINRAFQDKDDETKTKVLDNLVRKTVQELDLISSKNLSDNKRREYAFLFLSGLAKKLLIADTWSAWETDSKRGDPSEETICHYRAVWERFHRWLQKNRVKIEYLHEIDDMTAEDYAKDLWEEGITPRTYNAHIAFLKHMFRILKKTAGLNENVWDQFQSKRLETNKKHRLDENQVRKLISEGHGNVPYWIALGFYTGLRLKDVITLKWSEVDLQKKAITRVPSKTRNKSINFPIHPALLKMLNVLKKKSGRSEYLFPKEAKIYAKDSSAITKQIRRHFIKCGIETSDTAEGDHRKKAKVNFSFHSLRHTFVSICADNNISRAAVMEIVGHSSAIMNEYYSHAGEESKANAIQSLPDIITKTTGRRGKTK